MFRILLTFLILAFFSLAAAGEPGNYRERAEVRDFAQEMAAEHGFPEDGVVMVLGHADYKQSIIDAISRPAERVLTWAEYQDIFLTSRRIESGREFMLQYKDALLQAQEVYGVPPIIVTAIIGVETMYGRHRGNYRVLDALSTLAFDYPPRSEFFRGELEQFLLLVREQDQSITDLKGSYAGAMGYGQFIPSSYRAYAVDFDEDGVVDIWNNPVDAIGSVANYIARHGWQADAEVLVRADAGEVQPAWFNQSLEPTSTVGDMATLGVVTDDNFAADLEVAPLLYQGKQGEEYWLGFRNFYVITRYNHSRLYAMAIFQLSEALRYEGQLANHH